jgi:hypothetical protein
LEFTEQAQGQGEEPCRACYLVSRPVDSLSVGLPEPAPVDLPGSAPGGPVVGVGVFLPPPRFSDIDTSTQ